MQHKAKLAWIEILRVVSTFGILFYHSGLAYTHHAFTPTPYGLSDNWLALISALTDKFGYSINIPLGFISLFGFQFLDVFILLIGLTMVLSWRKQETYPEYVKRRCLRVLWPFWLAVLLNLILSAIDHFVWGGYIAPSWNWFAAITFPLAYDFHGALLQQISGPWWFVPFMLAVIAVSPFMLNKLGAWGIKNFLLLFGLLGWAYRLLCIYGFGAHANYATIPTEVMEAPYLLLPAKIFLVALGMVLGQIIKNNQLPTNRAGILIVAVVLYIIGFVAQFSWLGWTLAEFLYAPAIVMVFYALFITVKDSYFTSLIIYLGTLSYAFFLIHDLFVNRLTKYLGTESLTAFWQIVLLSTLCSLLLAVVINKLAPSIAKACAAGWALLDQKLKAGLNTG